MSISTINTTNYSGGGHTSMPATVPQGDGLEEYLNSPVLSKEPEIHSVGDYFDNLGKSTWIGFQGGAGYGLHTSVEIFKNLFTKPEETQTWKNAAGMAFATTGTFSGAVIGSVGGCMMGVAGHTIGTHILNRDYLAFEMSIG